MSRILSLALSGILLILISVACEESVPAGSTVDIFLLETFQTVEGTWAIEPTSVVLEEAPLIPYDQLTFYNSAEFVFMIGAGARNTLGETPFPVGGTAFAVTVDREVIYTGYFIPSHSSVGCQWVVIDPLPVHSSGMLSVKLGYPGPMEGVEIPDLRNDERILEVFRRDGKLED